MVRSPRVKDFFAVIVGLEPSSAQPIDANALRAKFCVTAAVIILVLAVISEGIALLGIGSIIRILGL